MQIKKINSFNSIRFIIACIYIVSGIEKLLQPHANFVYVIQGYDIVPYEILEELAAHIFPWLELIIGVFLLLGLWIRFALSSIGCFSAMFIVIVGQAILRKLPIEECGCFGDLVSIPLGFVFLLDVVILINVSLLLFYIKQTSALSFDNCYESLENSN